MADFVASLGFGAYIYGTEGFDTLRLEGLQAITSTIYNSTSGSGGRYVVRDVSTGASGLVDYRNIESIIGSPYGDLLMGSVQLTSLYGEGGGDTLIGQMDTWSSFLLRGGDGADSLAGGDVFDDLNGNRGTDTLHGYDGADWVLGGQDNDLVFGDVGDDFVHGNMGDDSVNGDDGADTVLGGQGNDVLDGGPGADHLFGHRGLDTLYGGGGPDVFHVEIGMGADVIADFSVGDRVQVDGDVAFDARQAGPNVVIRLVYGTDGAAAVTEVQVLNVQLATLPEGWLSH